MVLETRNSTNSSQVSPSIAVVPVPRPPSALELTTVSEISDPTEFLEAVLGLVELLSGNAEFITGREEFFWKTGKVFVDDPFYEERTNYFLTHFFLSRPLSADPKVGASYRMLTPLEGLLKLCEAEANSSIDLSSLLLKLREMEQYEHGLYQITKVLEGSIAVKNLVTEEKHTLTARPGTSFLGLRNKEIFQGFMAPFLGILYLMPGIIIHPSSVTRSIKRFVKIAKKSESFDLGSLLYRLASVQLKHRRHGHVDPRKIYDNELLSP